MRARQERDEGAFSRTREIVASPKLTPAPFPRSAVGMHTVPLRGTDHARETGDGYIATGAVILPIRVAVTNQSSFSGPCPGALGERFGSLY